MEHVETPLQTAKQAHTQITADTGTQSLANGHPPPPGREGRAHSVSDAHLWIWVSTVTVYCDGTSVLSVFFHNELCYESRQHGY